eukprot:1160913-Pelagomonas_calceolata.AAC.4
MSRTVVPLLKLCSRVQTVVHIPPHVVGRLNNISWNAEAGVLKRVDIIGIFKNNVLMPSHGDQRHTPTHRRVPYFFERRLVLCRMHSAFKSQNESDSFNL